MFAKPKRRKNPGTKAGGKKAAKTRKKNAAKRSAAGRKAARTRAKNHAKRSRAAKRGATKRKRGGKRRTRRNVAVGVGAKVSARSNKSRRRRARRNPAGVSSARVTKIERKLGQVVKSQHVIVKKVSNLQSRVTRLDGVRKALGLPAGKGGLRKAEDDLQDRAVALEMAARRKNPKRKKKHGKKSRRGRRGRK